MFELSPGDVIKVKDFYMLILTLESGNIGSFRLFKSLEAIDAYIRTRRLDS
jgi:hypothetical protein